MHYSIGTVYSKNIFLLCVKDRQALLGKDYIYFLPRIYSMYTQRILFSFSLNFKEKVLNPAKLVFISDFHTKMNYSGKKM